MCSCNSLSSDKPVVFYITILRDLSPLQRKTLIAWILEACGIS